MAGPSLAEEVGGATGDSNAPSLSAYTMSPCCSHLLTSVAWSLRMCSSVPTEVDMPGLEAAGEGEIHTRTQIQKYALKLDNTMNAHAHNKRKGPQRTPTVHTCAQ